MMEELKQRLLDEMNLAVRRLDLPPVNDPLAFDRINNAMNIARVRTLKHPDVPSWMTPLSVNDKLAELCLVLPLIPAHAPARIRQLADRTFNLLLSDMTIGAEEQVRGEIMSALSGHREVDLADALLKRLHEVRFLADDAFPHGLVPPEPEWPDDIRLIRDGEAWASEAFSILHLQGWVGETDLGLVRGQNLAAARKRHAARLAFAERAAGPKAVADIHGSWLPYLLRAHGPAQAWAELGPVEQWDGPRDFDFANQIAQLFIRDDDWDSADRVTQVMLEWTGPIDEEHRTSLAYKRRRIDRHNGVPAPKKARSPRTQGARPTRITPPPAPPRPAVSQTIVDLAERGDAPAADFVARLLQGETTDLVDLLMRRDLTIGHLWLLFEVDNQWINGQILKHPGVSDDLTAWILRRPRHGKNRRPGMSGYASLFADQRLEFAAAVLSYADDADLIGTALRSQADYLPLGLVAELIKRTLDWPTRVALPVITNVEQAIGHRLPTELLELVKQAGESAARDATPSSDTVAALNEALLTYPRDVTAVPIDQSTQEFVSHLIEAPDLSRIEKLLHTWRGELPWDELTAAIDRGEFGSDVLVRLARKPSAPAGVLRRAFPHVVGEFLVGQVDNPLRWLEALLEEPIDESPSASFARSILARRALCDDVAGLDVLKTRMSTEEWGNFVEPAVIAALGNGSESPEQKELVFHRAVAMGAAEEINVARLTVHLPFEWAARYWLALYPDADITSLTTRLGKPVPVALVTWLTRQLEAHDRELDAAIIDDTVKALTTWNGPLRELVPYAEELQERRDYPEEYESGAEE